MFASLKKRWDSFLNTPAGERFQKAHEERNRGRGQGDTAVRACYLGGGIVLTLAGLLLLPLPGPGSLVAVAGLAMLARESMNVAKGLDWADLKLENAWATARERWKKCSLAQRSGLVAVVLLLALGAAYGVWVLWIR